MRHNSSQPNAYAPGAQQQPGPMPAQVNGAPVQSNPQPADKQAMTDKEYRKRQMIAQILTSHPFQNPQTVQPQFQLYS